jgi:hypothetical protein
MLPHQVALLKDWLSRVGLPLASSGRGEARGGQDVVLRAVHELTGRPPLGYASLLRCRLIPSLEMLWCRHNDPLPDSLFLFLY